jgi:ElaB/YqjD/DUF883 family membrane-anchored ribosome-binding protein
MSSQKIQQYWWCLNGLMAEPFSFPNFIDCSDVEWDQILNGLGLRGGKKGNITESKATEFADKIGKDCAQFSPFDFQREVMNETTKQKEQKTIRGYFIRLGSMRSKYSQKVGYQFKDLKLEDGPEPGIHKQRMVKEERSELQNILQETGPPLLLCKPGPPRTQSLPPQDKKQTQQSDDASHETMLYQQIGELFGQSGTVSRYHSRELKKIIQAYIQQIMTSIAEEMDDHQDSKTVVERSGKSAQPATNIEQVPTAVLLNADTNIEQVPSAVLLNGSDNEVAMQVALRDFIKHHFGQKQRTLMVPANNGRNFLLIHRPYSRDVPSFIRGARDSKWIQEMLPEEHHITGICVWLYNSRPDIYTQIAEIHGQSIERKVPFANTLAIASEVGLLTGQLRQLKSFLKTQGVTLEIPDNQIARINQQVGNNISNDPQT